MNLFPMNNLNLEQVINMNRKARRSIAKANNFKNILGMDTRVINPRRQTKKNDKLFQ